MEFHELIREILISQTPEGRERALKDAHDASWNLYLDDLDRTNDHATAERAFDRRQNRIAVAESERTPR